MELSNYRVVSVIGTGSFGTCYKVEEKLTGKVFAWKAIDYGDLKESAIDSLITEINLMRQLKHPNIVQYFDNIVNKETKTVYIVMECCDGGDLSQLISKCKLTRSRFEERFIWRVLYQICKALQLCHNKLSEGIVLHRDIKPANVFLDAQGNVKLGDFGLARILRKNEKFADSFVGTPYYMSPEIIKSKKYDRKSDIWSVGCLIYEMSALRPPFRGLHFDQLSKNISVGKFTNIPEYYSSDLRELICFMLDVERDSRPTIEVILRNPILVRNVPSSKQNFPLLLPSPLAERYQKLEFSPKDDMSSTQFSPPASFDKSNFSSCVSRLYESVNLAERSRSDSGTCSFEEKLIKNQIAEDPDVITQNIFNEALQIRLQAIRAKESLLRQKEADLDTREKQLSEREMRLTALDKTLNQRKLRIETLLKKSGLDARVRKIRNSHMREKSPDDTYCSIEPNESVLKPTVAKLDLAAMPPPKSFSRKIVTFESPKKFVKYNIENIPPNPEPSKSFPAANLKSSTASNDSEESQKRKSILSIFGISNQKAKEKHSRKQMPPVEVLDPAGTLNLAQMWTSQNKKAAFHMLATMNAEEKETGICGSESSARCLSRNKQQRSMLVTSREKMLL